MIKEIIARFSLATPTIFKKIGNAGIYAATTGAGLVGLDQFAAVHVHLHPIIPTIGGYMLAVGSVIKVICGLPVSDPKALSAKMEDSK